MAASRIQNIMIDSFLDGITGAAFFGKLRIPGAPTVLVDERSPDEAYPEYDAAISRLQYLKGMSRSSEEAYLKDDHVISPSHFWQKVSSSLSTELPGYNTPPNIAMNADLRQSGTVSPIRPLLKRLFDIVFSLLTLIVFSPILLLIAIAVRLDSRGPVFYVSERIGKKGRIFRSFKFRTMVPDAYIQWSDIVHLNEREDVLFKISDGPRITRLGRFLRKYSLDELPQFLSVLRGDMSVVGPRPLLASEVREFKLSDLRRLCVTPGIIDRWQAQARQDLSFEMEAKIQDGQTASFSRSKSGTTPAIPGSQSGVTSPCVSGSGSSTSS
ncbi:MAG: sugar transferase [Terracidiphilus sp.]